MERVNRILEHDGYQECLRKNETAEKDRRFCRHDMAHFLDVARIAWILNLQEEAEQSRSSSMRRPCFTTAADGGSMKTERPMRRPARRSRRRFLWNADLRKRNG